MNEQDLSTQFDAVVIFDLFSDSQRHKFKMTLFLDDLLTDLGAPVRFYYCDSREDLVADLAILQEEAAQGKKFWLHFVGFGNRNGILFKHLDAVMHWPELEAILLLLHQTSGHTLVINLTSCFGLQVLKTMNPFSSDAVFLCLVGYAGKLKVKGSKKINALLYTKLMEFGKPNDAVQTLQSELSDKNLYCICKLPVIYFKNGE